jgi:16S rRNA (guanine966-N2)-methyltransferase
MRIIAGRYRSRVLEAPAGMSTRPTSDRLRETLFNVLAPRLEGAAFLDLYAGSGAVGLEALSRGARSVVFVERAPAALKVLRGNLAALDVREGFRVEARSVGAFLRSAAAGPKPGPQAVVFLDPPYEASAEYERTLGLLGGSTSHPRSQNRDLGHPSDARGPLSIGIPRSQNRDLGHPSDAGELGHPGSFLNADAVVVAEHRRKEKLEDRYGVLRRTRVLEQGDAALSFYSRGD